jgi:aminoglycoside phosphotransferase (APT) family kinase protein
MALERECHWLPKLAPRLPLLVPEPVMQGRPADGYPVSWAIYRWIDGQPYADDLVADERQATSAAAREWEAGASGPGPSARSRWWYGRAG